MKVSSFHKKLCFYIVLLSLLSLLSSVVATDPAPTPATAATAAGVAATEEPESDDELEDKIALYNGDSVEELLELCKDFNVESDFIVESGKDERQCVPGKKCIPHCDEERITRLIDAQTRVKQMVRHLSDPNRSLWPFLLFFIVLFQGAYLIIVKHFNWRTLPFIPGYDMYVNDPTDGYRYRHYMWMQKVILDSDHPTYYHGMTADSQELEYEPQYAEWDDPEAGSDEEIHLPWSVTDILDMTADPDERLEIYFRRIQQKYNLNKPPRHMKKLKNAKRRK